jgi:hypothetical protein
VRNEGRKGDEKRESGRRAKEKGCGMRRDGIWR